MQSNAISKSKVNANLKYTYTRLFREIQTQIIKPIIKMGAGDNEVKLATEFLL